MTKFGTAAIAGAALLALAGSAFAQDTMAQHGAQHGRVIEVPPGMVVVILPAGAPVYAVLALAAMPDPFAMIRQMQAEMSARMSMMTAGAAPTDDMPHRQGVSIFSISSVVNGGGSCTREIAYDGHGQPHVRVFGNACGTAPSGGRPASQPVPAPAPAAPGLIEAAAHGPAAPLEVAALR